jgi:hypothetical protein
MYQLPDAKGYTSMQRYLAGEADDLRSAGATRFSVPVSPTFEPLQMPWQS